MISPLDPKNALETPLQRRLPIYALLSANTISSIGNMLTALAIPWFVLSTTQSYTQMGITAFAGTLPNVISSFFSSLIVDRLGYKRTSVLSDISSGLSVMLIPLLSSTGGLAFWQLLVLVFLGGLLKSPGDVARHSLTPDLAELAEVPLERANAFLDGISRAALFIGAPLAGVLIAFIGTGNLLWLDAISFFISALLIGVVLPSSAPIQRQQKPGRHFLADVTAGLHFISQHQVILALVMTAMITNLLDAAHSAVLMPAYIKQFYGNAVPLGILAAAFGGPALLGTLIFGAIGQRWPKRLTFGLCFLLLSLRFWMLALQLPFPMLLLLNALSGLAVGPLNPIVYTLQQRLTPAEKRASVFGVVGAGYLLGIPLGGLLGGYIVTWFGLQPGLFIMGAWYTLTTASVLINPRLKAMDGKLETENG